MKLVGFFASLFLVIAATSAFYLQRCDKKLNHDQAVASIMNFQIKHIRDRCQKEFSYTDEDIDLLERELKRYFILVRNNALPMYSKDVDNLWHAFILFTRKYAQFCKQCMGRFIHHVPKTADTAEESPEERRKKFLKFIELYEETFKEEIHPIWLLDSCEA